MVATYNCYLRSFQELPVVKLPTRTFRNLGYQFVLVALQMEWGMSEIMRIDVAIGAAEITNVCHPETHEMGASEQLNSGEGILAIRGPEIAPALPEYDTFDSTAIGSAGYRIKVARDFEDMAKIFAIRGSAYFSDSEHLYAKHFDGNDFSSTHLIGYVDGEPVATVRIRYFADFTRIERLAVRPTHRKSRISFKLAKAAFAFCRDKGYKRLSGVAREELVPFWAMLGFKIDESKAPIFIYGLPHFEMRLDYAETPNAVTAESHPLILLRPEGRWHQAGYHETGQTNGAALPAENAPSSAKRRSTPRDIAVRLAGAAASRPNMAEAPAASRSIHPSGSSGAIAARQLTKT
jgi:predicted GNAT family N-acyltransferase